MGKQRVYTDEERAIRKKEAQKRHYETHKEQVKARSLKRYYDQKALKEEAENRMKPEPGTYGKLKQDRFDERSTQPETKIVEVNELTAEQKQALGIVSPSEVTLSSQNPEYEQVVKARREKFEETKNKRLEAEQNNGCNNE